ncbi:MAG TPA: TIGR02206 family membrane protein [Cryomorphaceae bacterium]|nr:TIGR02206 family membrane protein [Cryomorphaceae bacterium]|tara:strand:- start:2155 stop:2865 length:711 start_codon:yes stop_codon:yes gene_type:complete
MDLHVAITSDHPLYFIGWGVVLFMIFFPIFVANNASIRIRKNFEIGWAILLVASYFAMTGVSMFRGEASWSTSLLCHMCGFSRMLAIGYLLTRKKWMGEMVTFMGIVGGLQSFITPEFTHGLHPVYIFDYHFNHASIVAIGFYIIFGHKQALRKGAWLRTFGRIQLLALLALVVNFITGGNYMYLMEPPIVDNPLIVQSESFPHMYVIFFQIFAAALFFLLQVVLSRLKIKPTLSY